MNEEPQRIAVFAGAFDPVQNGHLDTLFRGAEIFDKIYVLIAPNADKKPLLSADDRSNIFSWEIEAYDKGNGMSGVRSAIILSRILKPGKLTVQFAQEMGAQYLLRGIRNQMDWAYEETIRHANARLCTEFGLTQLETVYLGAPLNDNLYVSSTLVRGLLKTENWQRAIGAFVPGSTVSMLERRRSKGRRN